MLQLVKQAIRIDGTEHDIELAALISAAKALLRETGIKRLSDDDPLISQAVVTYCKATFGNEAKNGEAYMNAFEEMRKFLSFNLAYTTEG